MEYRTQFWYRKASKKWWYRLSSNINTSTVPRYEEHKTCTTSQPACGGWEGVSGHGRGREGAGGGGAYRCWPAPPAGCPTPVGRCSPPSGCRRPRSRRCYRCRAPPGSERRAAGPDARGSPYSGRCRWRCLPGEQEGNTHGDDLGNMGSALGVHPWGTGGQH